MLNILSIIHYLQQLPTEIINLILLLICYISIFLLCKYFKKSGLYVYNVIAFIACNLQVLKAMQFDWYSEPLALGTIIYASTFLASDIICEIYSEKEAKKAVGLSFAASIILLVMMVVALGFKPISLQNQHDISHFNQAHDALFTIFTPNVAILAASLIAYVSSQLGDIFIYSRLKEKATKSLFLRVLISVSCAVIIDTILFNMFAWKIFATHPVDNHSLFYNYMLGGYIMQMIVAAINIIIFPFLIKKLKNNDHKSIS